jgi:hypothetical protein
MIIEKDKKTIVQSHDFDSVNCTIDAEDMRYVASLLRNNYSTLASQLLEKLLQTHSMQTLRRILNDQ